MDLEEWGRQRKMALEAIQKQFDEFREFAETYWNVAEVDDEVIFNGMLQVHPSQAGTTTCGIVDRSEFFGILRRVKGWIQRAEAWGMPPEWEEQLYGIWLKQIETEFRNRRKEIE